MNSLLITFIVSWIIQIILFIPAYFFRTDKITDISYAITYIVLASLFVSSNIKELILYFMILFWAIRLGSYLYYRIIKIKIDHRFDTIRRNPLKFFGFWFYQGWAAPIILLPATLTFIWQAPFSKFSYIGLVVFAIGFLTETIADQQKLKHIISRSDKWIETGLWKYSRHPNYFGEILVWAGIYLYCLPYLGQYAMVGFVGPLFLTSLILFVSGVPILERHADEKYNENKEYIEYKKKTNLIIPWFR